MRTTDDVSICADVIYRARTVGGGDAEIRLAIAPEAATVADAWKRLTAAFDGVDPASLEIEIREAPSSSGCAADRLPRPSCRRPDLVQVD